MELSTALYQEIAKSNEPRIFEAWHASSISECPRAQYFKRLGVPELSTPTAGKMLRWQVGHLVESAIRPHLRKLYPNLASNVRFKNEELDLTGEIDNYDPDTHELIEIKSIGPRAVRYRKKEETRPHLRDDGPYLSHELQQHAYVTLMRAPKTKLPVPDLYSVDDLIVEKITYLYISLEGLIVPYSTEVKPDLLENVWRRLAVLNKAWASKVPPECLCSPEHPLWGSQTQFCSYRNNTEAPGVKCCDLSLLSKFEEIK